MLRKILIFCGQRYFGMFRSQKKFQINRSFLDIFSTILRCRVAMGGHGWTWWMQHAFWLVIASTLHGKN